MGKSVSKRITGASVDSLVLAFIQLLTFATNIIATKILSTVLPLGEYATYSAANLIMNVGTSATLLGLGDCLNYYYNNKAVCKDRDSRISYVNTIYLLQSLIGIGAAAILLAANRPISSYFEDPALRPLTLLICLRPALQNLVHLYQVLFVSCGRSRIIAVRNMVIALLRIAMVWFSVVYKENLQMFFILSLGVDVLQLVTFSALFGKGQFYVNPAKGSAAKFRSVLSYGIPMGVYFITNTLMREVDKIVVGGLGTAEDLAVYSNCSKLLPLNILVVSFATVLVPHIMGLVSEKKFPKAAKLFKDYISIGYLSIWMLAGAILVSAREVVPFLYSDAYLPGLPVFVLYIVDAMLQFASLHLIVTANGDSKYLMKLSLALLGVNTVLNVALYYLFSLWGMSLLGPAVATVLVTLVYNVLLIRKSSQILQEKVSAILPVGQMLQYAAVLLVAGVGFFALKKYLLQLGVERYTAMLLVCAGYCVCVFGIYFKRYLAALKGINQYKIQNAD